MQAEFSNMIPIALRDEERQFLLTILLVHTRSQDLDPEELECYKRMVELLTHARVPSPLGPTENVGSIVEPGPNVKTLGELLGDDVRPLWDKTGTTWHTDTKAGRYSVRRSGKRMPFQAYLNNNAIPGDAYNGRVDEVKTAVERRILEARRIAHMEK